MVVHAGSFLLFSVAIDLEERAPTRDAVEEILAERRELIVSGTREDHVTLTSHLVGPGSVASAAGSSRRWSPAIAQCRLQRTGLTSRAPQAIAPPYRRAPRDFADSRRR